MKKLLTILMMAISISNAYAFVDMNNSNGKILKLNNGKTSYISKAIDVNLFISKEFTYFNGYFDNAKWGIVVVPGDEVLDYCCAILKDGELYDVSSETSISGNGCFFFSFEEEGRILFFPDKEFKKGQILIQSFKV